MAPTVSILIPCFNQSTAYLRAALFSAKMQTHPCQIVVVDDGSRPAQEEIVDAVLARSVVGGWTANYCYHWQENGGVASALNKAIELSDGAYVQWLPSDDLFMPRKTEVQLQAMLDADMAVSFCAYEEGIPQPVNTWPAAQYPSREHLFTMLCQHSFINAVTVMWRRDVFEEVGTFNKEMIHLNDSEFILRCAERYQFLAVNEPLVRRRTHPGQMSQTLKDPAERAKKERDVAYVNQRYGASLKVWVPQ